MYTNLNFLYTAILNFILFQISSLLPESKKIGNVLYIVISSPLKKGDISHIVKQKLKIKGFQKDTHTDRQTTKTGDQKSLT